MVEKEFEESDPFELIGMQIQVANDRHIVAMAETFIEEYLRMGWPAVTIFELFKLPFYKGPHAALKILGEERVKKMIAESKARIDARRRPNSA